MADVFPPRALRKCCDAIRNHFLSTTHEHLGGPIEYEEGYDCLPLHPMWLTDRHLAPTLTLKRVVHLGDMLGVMKTLYQESFVDYLTNNDVFPSTEDLPLTFGIGLECVGSPTAFAASYNDAIGMLSRGYASILLVHPNESYWQTNVLMKPHIFRPVFHHEVDVFVPPDDVPSTVLGLESERAKNLDSTIANKLRVIRDRSDTLAIFSYIPLCPNANYTYVVKDMSCPFNTQRDWTFAATVGSVLPARDIVPPIDDPNAWWNRFVPSERTSQATKKPGIPRNLKSVRIPARSGTRREVYQPEAPDFIQRAWCRAVENDCTFIVFNCGRGEKIGIRHRSSNTLFISPLIDPFEEPYTHTHMALHWAILKDALERTPCVSPPQTDKGKGKRRRTGEGNYHATRSSKRLRGERPSMDHVQPVYNVDREISSRNILLVSFDFGVYHSPAPSSFIRTSPSCHPDFISRPSQKVTCNRAYPKSQCLDFVAKEKLGTGRAGTSFRGTLTIHTPSGDIIEERVVLKIPLGIQPAKAIHTEYNIYEKLRESGVNSGIVKVYGVFEDIETGSVALVMQDGGTDILRRESIRTGQEYPPQMSLSSREYETLLSIMKKIHAAGVIHNDVKPSNIVVNQAGDLCFIDFEGASFSPRIKHGSLASARFDEKVASAADLLTIDDLYFKTYAQAKNYLC